MALLALASVASPQTAGAQLRIAEAVATAIGSHPVIHLQIAARQARLGELRIERGAFASRLSTEIGVARDRAPLSSLQRAQTPGIDQAITDTTFYSTGVQRRLRTGQTLSTGLEVSRASLAVEGQSSVLAQIPAFEDDTISRFRMELRQPLLKGAGRTATTGAERSAERNLAAADLDLLHAGSERALAAATAYWRYTASLRVLEIAEISEQRSAQLHERTQTLIRADKQAAADISQLDADLAGKRAQRILARQDVLAARQELARQIGFGAAEGLQRPADALPFADAIPLPDGVGTAEYTRFATRHRRDLQAARKRSAAALALYEATRENTEHRLDLTASLGYTGLDSGSGLDRYLTAIGRNVGGANYGVGLQYEYEFGNESAEGRAQAAQAAFQASRITQLDIARNVALDVDIALNELRAARAALLLTEAALEAERAALQAEQRRYRSGLVTLFTLTQFQDRLDAAANRRVEAQRRLATAVVTLRHVTGTLLRPNAPGLAPLPGDFVSLPQLADASYSEDRHE